ncbi:MAG TPA: HIT family protein [Mycobacteriales bacterium]|nr:HIT family protein [Mycobacteriales bacterium]
MPSVFSRIIAGELPGRIVYSDDQAVALLTIAPLTPGHTLVVPRAEIDHWIDLDEQLAEHLMRVARRVGRGLRAVFPERKRVGLIIAGLEVPHAHLHVFAFDSESQIDFAKVDPSPDAAEQDRIADNLRAAIEGAA